MLSLFLESLAVGDEGMVLLSERTFAEQGFSQRGDNLDLTTLSKDKEEIFPWE
jgi:hypothetical protein